MAFQVTAVGNEPIVIVKLGPEIDSAAVDRTLLLVAEEVRQIAERFSEPVYRITDLRPLEGTDVALVEVIKGELLGLPGTASDPRIVTVPVITAEMLKMPDSDKLTDVFEALDMRVCHAIDEAVAFARHAHGGA